MSKLIKNFKKLSYGPAPEDSSEVFNWINKLRKPNYIFINGKFVKSKGSKKINIINPRTKDRIGKLSISSK